MPPFGPIRRSDLIFYLRRAGFAGPEAGGKHEYLVRGQRKVYVPNPHRGDISKQMLARLLREAEISRDEWEKL
jgi:predicted RNA binding protein YcfA (HicA-like mRNA interferase family)